MRRESRMSNMCRSLLLAAGLLLLVSCTSAPPVQEWSGPAPEQIVAEIRATGAFEKGELDVQPLRDPMIEDLRVQAAQYENVRRYSDAAAALDKAIAISPQDPALLQERAEVAVLLKDLDKAAALARDAYALGGKVGPLCRRHWATIRLQPLGKLRALHTRADIKQPKGEKLAQWQREVDELGRAAAAAERSQMDCTLTGPPRY
jgi:tetratricopeptide (TPR) repeat protein